MISETAVRNAYIERNDFVFEEFLQHARKIEADANQAHHVLDILEIPRTQAASEDGKESVLTLLGRLRLVQHSLARQEELETALLLTLSWLKKFQDRFDHYGDAEYGTFAYGHRQHVESVLGKPALTNEPAVRDPEQLEGFDCRAGFAGTAQPLTCANCGEESTNPGQFLKDGRWVCTNACRKELCSKQSYDDLAASGGIVDAP